MPGTTPRPVDVSPDAVGSFAWWSWRPGMSPFAALLIGLPLMLLASACTLTGLYTLVTGIVDSLAPRLQQAGATNLPGALFLFLFGCLLLPYPLFLTFGGWHDLRRPLETMTGNVVGLHTTQRGRMARPGLTPRGARAWHGIALQPLNALAPYPGRHVPIFHLAEEHYRLLKVGDIVRVTYTRHLLYVKSCQVVDRSNGNKSYAT